MKKILFFLSCLVVSVIVTSCAKDEDNLNGTIAGLVTDYTNANSPIAGATVTLSTKGLTKTTGSDGRFEFKGIEPGTYTLQVSANHYQTTTKQVTVYAGQTANCDFQLSAGAVSVDISPVTLNFGNNTEQLSFTITNNSTGTLTYTISGIPNFVQVSPTTGSVAARGKQAVTVTVINRASITSARNGQMTVNIGSDSYTISVNVEPYQTEAVNVDINPQALSFDKDTDQLKFTMSSNYSKDLSYTISSNLDILTVSPDNGTLAARGKAEISVSVKDRKNVTTERNGSLTISMGGNTYVVNVSVAKYEEDETPATPINTNRGLLAFYSFDENNADDMTGNKYHGVVSGGTFITDTPNGKGKALSMKAKDFVNIAYNPLSDKETQTVNMWIKDFGTGPLFMLTDGSYYWAPSLFINSDMKLSYIRTTGTKPSNLNTVYSTPTNLNSYSTGQWIMVTIVLTKTGLDRNLAQGNAVFYINGRRIDSVSNSNSSRGNSITIGGKFDTMWNDAFKVDNVRIHGVALTDEEIEAIYNAEKL
ncbi:MAG: carboxypeptidase regulatory-like domain-containing protein [Prevotella sp.]|nr:carboxypeptidase regulatory-like domain-containing protein [Prevotella sp.]